MILSLPFLILSLAIEIDNRELTIRKSDLNILIQVDTIDSNIIDLLWSILIKEAEKTYSSRIFLPNNSSDNLAISVLPENKTETLPFTEIPIQSVFVTATSLIVLVFTLIFIRFVLTLEHKNSTICPLAWQLLGL